ncbi:YqeG family HAD IIIA-type phosphatase, partial [Streptococcus suis]
MSLENFMPDFALEKSYDVTVESLKKHGIKVVFFYLDNTLIAWNNPDVTPEMRQGLPDLQDAVIPVVVV